MEPRFQVWPRDAVATTYWASQLVARWPKGARLSGSGDPVEDESGRSVRWDGWVGICCCWLMKEMFDRHVIVFLFSGRVFIRPKVWLSPHCSSEGRKNCRQSWRRPPQVGSSPPAPPRPPSEMACFKTSYQLAPESFLQADGFHLGAANSESPPVSQSDPRRTQGTRADGARVASLQAAVVQPPQWRSASLSCLLGASIHPDEYTLEQG